jgi:hypothetical protein
MRRNSQATTALMAQLKAANITLGGRPPSGRAIERLSHSQLLLPGEPLDRACERFRQLDALGYGPGCSVDRIARILLARGFPSEAARQAIFRQVVGDDLDPARFAGPLPDLSPKEMAQAIYEALEDRTSFLWPIFGRLSSCLVQGGRTDHAGALIGPLEETPEQRRAAFARSIAQGAFGWDIDDPTPLIDLYRLVGGLKPLQAMEDLSIEEEEVAEEIFSLLLPLAAAWSSALFTSPLEELGEAAVGCRQIFAPANLLARLLGQSWTAETIDDAAATFSPAMLLFQHGLFRDGEAPSWWPWEAPKGRPWWWPPKRPRSRRATSRRQAAHELPTRCLQAAHELPTRVPARPVSYRP